METDGSRQHAHRGLSFQTPHRDGIRSWHADHNLVAADLSSTLPRQRQTAAASRAINGPLAPKALSMTPDPVEHTATTTSGRMHHGGSPRRHGTQRQTHLGATIPSTVQSNMLRGTGGNLPGEEKGRLHHQRD